MNHPTESYIISLLLNLKDSHLFEDGDLYSHLKALSENYFSEETAQKAKEDAQKFINFYKKNSLLSPSISKELSTVPLRMYMDGVFDMVHSGHFNAIRQVITTISISELT